MSKKKIENASAMTKLTSTSSPHSVFLQEYSLVSEFNLVKHHVDPGIYVIPSAKTPFIWFGVIFVRSGIYTSGIFRFSLFIPHSFPDCSMSPNLVFESPVFHPQVDPTTHELYLGSNSSLTEWRKDVNHLWQVISYLKSIFYNVVPDGSINKNAANLFITNQDEYTRLAKECVENSKKQIYNKLNDDPHYLLFDKFDAQVHEPYREMLREDKSNLEGEGHPVSWVQQGSLEPLSKLD